jgi:hypothetical protein
VLAEIGRRDFFFRTRAHAGSARLEQHGATRQAGGRPALASEIYRHGVYDTEGEAFRITARLFTAFYEQAQLDGAAPVVLVCSRTAPISIAGGASAASATSRALAFLHAKGYRVIDATDALETPGHERNIGELIPLHFAPLANELLAQYLYRRFRELDLLAPGGSSPAEIRSSAGASGHHPV